MRVCLISLAVAAAMWPALALSAPAWLIAGASETVARGQPLLLQVVKPAEAVEWPATMRLRLIAADKPPRDLLLGAVEGENYETLRRTYSTDIPPDIEGLVRVQLLEAESNRLALLVVDPEPLGRDEAPELSANVAVTEPPGLDENTAYPANLAESAPPRGDEATLPALSINEPMYFLVGEHASAKFQLSFKYQLFDPEGIVARPMPFLSGMYFGYTQTSFWDLGEDSRPFRDTSYRPTFFWEGKGPGVAWWPEQWRAGYEHESNGRDDEESRSIDMLFLQPTWSSTYSVDSVLKFSPKFHVYLDREENPNIQRYRGYAEWNLLYGKADGLLLSAKYRQGTAGYASGQLDTSYPLGRKIFTNIGSFLHLQWFSGYGETLLDYDRHRDDQLRIGISIVR